MKNNIIILAIVLSSSLGIFSINESILYAKNKKEKQVKVQKKKKQVEQQNVVPIKDSKDIQEYYNYTARDNIKILEQIIILSEKLEKRFTELEKLSLYHDEQLTEIKDCLYKKYIDSSYCPFEYFKKWFDDPFNKSELNIKRVSAEK